MCSIHEVGMIRFLSIKMGVNDLEQLNLHQRLEHASEQIKEAGQAVIQAQGSDHQLVELAQKQLQQAEQELKNAQNTAGTEATDNSQFQHAYEQLHDTRQQIQEIKKNNNNIL